MTGPEGFEQRVIFRGWSPGSNRGEFQTYEGQAIDVTMRGAEGFVIGKAYVISIRPATPSEQHDAERDR